MEDREWGVFLIVHQVSVYMTGENDLEDRIKEENEHNGIPLERNNDRYYQERG